MWDFCGASYWIDTTGSCSSNPHRELFIQPQPRMSQIVQPTPCSLFIKRHQVRSALVSSSSEGFTRVQLTTRDRSGFSNVASAIARVQLEPTPCSGSVRAQRRAHTRVHVREKRASLGPRPPTVTGNSPKFSSPSLLPRFFRHGRPKECPAAASPAHPGRKSHFLS